MNNIFIIDINNSKIGVGNHRYTKDTWIVGHHTQKGDGWVQQSF